MLRRDYIDIAGIEQRAEEKRNKEREEHNKRIERMNKVKEKEQKQMQELIKKATSLEREEQQQKQTNDMEKEKAKAISEIEAKYSKNNLMASKTSDDDLRTMLRNMNSQI